MNLTTLIGLAAAICTTLSYVPQLKKCWTSGSSDDLSLKMVLTLLTGITLWVIYGVLQGDAVIILANTVSWCLLAGLLYFKLRDYFGTKAHRGQPGEVAAEAAGAGRKAHPARPVG